MKKGYTDEVKDLYKKSLSSLVLMQLTGGLELDFTKCFSAASFDKNAVLADLNYFKYFFLDLHKINYNKVRLNEEFEMLAKQIGQITPLYFMYRDFQGRNILISDNEPHFIDYQGGMKGPLQYDVASLLWQAKAQLPSDWRTELYIHYKQTLRKHIAFEEKSFDADYSLIVLVRLLQVLGSYGLRGIIERRAHFLSSIPLGLANLKEWRSHFALERYEELSAVMIEMATQITEQQPGVVKAFAANKLKVIVQSFSYKQGIPEDMSGNGGGFVFDCRGLLNPGRFDEYKKKTGRDREVIDFLESKTRVDEFLKHAKAIVDISMEDYLNRGFENLMISFGCTGGQHRSVYCTDAMAQHLKETYGIDATVRHLVQDAKDWVN
ncbi:nucleotide-binding protein MCA0739 [Filimonas sp.]|nr:nucleotide-binding protein MCA0739 [Filimonas sp.]